MKTIKLTLLILSLALLFSCGGGGGSGSGSSSSGVRVLNAAVDLEPIDVGSSLVTDRILKTVRFALESGYRSLPIGVQDISLTRRSGSPALPNVTIDHASGARNTIVIFGSEERSSLGSSLISDGTEVAEGMSAVRFVNGLSGSAGATMNVGGIELGSSIGLGLASAYASIPAGDLVANLSADGRSIFTGTFSFEAGKSYTLLAAGEIGFIVFVPQYQD